MMKDQKLWERGTDGVSSTVVERKDEEDTWTGQQLMTLQ